MASSTMTVRLEDKIKKRLDKLAELTHRSKSFLVADAISEYLKIQEWQINEINKGIAEANLGKLSDHNRILNYWRKKRAHNKRGTAEMLR